MNNSLDVKLGGVGVSSSQHISTVKLPQLHNRSMVNNDNATASTVDLSNIEVYNPYENRNSLANVKTDGNHYNN
jgi:hypothetical protein